jgi:hypothetical protein
MLYEIHSSKPWHECGDIEEIYHSAGRAHSFDGDGRLSPDAPGTEPPDVFFYSYNPLNPTPTVGGGGVSDQRPAEPRTDVLVYTTPPLR